MSAGVRLVGVPGLAAVVPYAYAAVAPAGAELVFLAGACPLAVDGRTLARGDVAAQTAVCVENLRIALQAAGGVLADVVFVRVLVASSVREDLTVARAVVREALEGYEAPGTLQGGVTELGWPDQLVEVEAVAAMPSRRPEQRWRGSGVVPELTHLTARRLSLTCLQESAAVDTGTYDGPTVPVLTLDTSASRPQGSVRPALCRMELPCPLSWATWWSSQC